MSCQVGCYASIPVLQRVGTHWVLPCPIAYNVLVLIRSALPHLQRPRHRSDYRETPPPSKHKKWRPARRATTLSMVLGWSALVSFSALGLSPGTRGDSQCREAAQPTQQTQTPSCVLSLGSQKAPGSHLCSGVVKVSEQQDALPSRRQVRHHVIRVHHPHASRDPLPPEFGKEFVADAGLPERIHPDLLALEHHRHLEGRKCSQSAPQRVACDPSSCRRMIIQNLRVIGCV